MGLLVLGNASKTSIASCISGVLNQLENLHPTLIRGHTVPFLMMLMLMVIYHRPYAKMAAILIFFCLHSN